MEATQEVEFSTMRTPKDVIRMIGVIATMDDKGISEWCDTDLREWVTKRYRARIAKEGKQHDLGGEGG